MNLFHTHYHSFGSKQMVSYAKNIRIGSSYGKYCISTSCSIRRHISTALNPFQQNFFVNNHLCISFIYLLTSIFPYFLMWLSYVITFWVQHHPLPSLPPTHWCRIAVPRCGSGDHWCVARTYGKVRRVSYTWRGSVFLYLNPIHTFF